MLIFGDRIYMLKILLYGIYIAFYTHEKLALLVILFHEIFIQWHS